MGLCRSRICKSSKRLRLSYHFYRELTAVFVCCVHVSTAVNTDTHFRVSLETLTATNAVKPPHFVLDIATGIASLPAFFPCFFPHTLVCLLSILAYIYRCNRFWLHFLLTPLVASSVPATDRSIATQLPPGESRQTTLSPAYRLESSTTL